METYEKSEVADWHVIAHENETVGIEAMCLKNKLTLFTLIS